MSIRELLKDRKKLRKITTAAFRTVDMDRSGFIESNEIEQILISSAHDLVVEVPSKTEIAQLMEQLDSTGNGRGLSLQEFQVLIEEVLGLMAE